MQIKTTLKCSECGEDVIVSSRQVDTDNIGEFKELIVFVEPCKCAARKSEELDGDDEILYL